MTDGWRRVLADGPKDLQTMLEQAIRDDLNAAFDALAEGDVARVACLAHRLKGSARLSGDERATMLCAALEAAGRASESDRARLLLVALRRAFGAARGLQ
ncbi:Hpt domain-containing protein [Paraburkholderia phymatum]|uniref:Hpt protein n=1 Tax=Paraburkholderia phymatum (strain DSM 17167 / CIP 108236 / LMG 21445 / STM815) TaxID=391038 RepID=B2JQB1_PARP8|nr:Hpt domain-containing protein [Paraburkholderia phymatum]ACC73452.1 Hpt protein [Paraburkholderia phymatum STM815]